MRVQCNLAKLLADKDMSRRECSRRTGVERNTVAAMCNNTIRQIPIHAIESICSLLKITPGDLLTIDQEEVTA